jgi:hypothetical protein
MTKRDFFRLLIKLFGLYSMIYSTFYILPSSFHLYYGTPLSGIIYIIVVLLTIILLFSLLIFKTDAVINLLKLDKGYDSDTIEISNFNPLSIVMLASLIFGGIILIRNIPSFLIHLYIVLKNIVGQPVDAPFIPPGRLYYLDLIKNTLLIFLGYLLVTRFTWLAKALTKNDNQGAR